MTDAPVASVAETTTPTTETKTETKTEQKPTTETTTTTTTTQTPAAPEVLQYTGVWIAQLTNFKGLFKMLPTAIGWQPSAETRQQHHGAYTPKTIAMAATDVTEICWTAVTPTLAQVQLGLRGAGEHRFGGFPAREAARFAAFVRAHLPHVAFRAAEAALGGHNWGEVRFTRSAMAFAPAEERDRVAFEVPCAAISQCALPTGARSEVSIEFAADRPGSVAAAAGRDAHQLVGMRLYVGSREEGAARALQRQLAERAQLGDLTGKGIAMLSGLQFLTPRGRYDMELFPTFLTLHGVSFDFRIHYAQITKLTALDRPSSGAAGVAGFDSTTSSSSGTTSGAGDESDNEGEDDKSGDGKNKDNNGESKKRIEVPRGASEYYFVVSLDTPLHQGQQLYTHLVLLVDNQREVRVRANLTPEAAERWPRLAREMASTAFGLVSTLLGTVTARTITTPGSFRTAEGARSIRCACRSNDGCLYPLEAALVFVPRPPCLLRYDDIHYIELERVSTLDRTFDITVVLRAAGTKHRFTSLPRRDYEDFRNFMLKKNIRMERRDYDAHGALGSQPVRADDDDDGGGEMSDDDEDYAEARARQRARAAAGGAGGAGGDEDDEDDDEDYNGSDDENDDSDDYDQGISDGELEAIGGSAAPAAKRSKRGSAEKEKDEKDEKSEKGEKKHKHHHRHHSDSDSDGERHKHKHKHHHSHSRDKKKD